MKTTTMIRTGLLQLIIVHGMSVREYNEVKNDIGIKENSSLIDIDMKLVGYKNK